MVNNNIYLLICKSETLQPVLVVKLHWVEQISPTINLPSTMFLCHQLNIGSLRLMGEPLCVVISDVCILATHAGLPLVDMLVAQCVLKGVLE